MSTVRSVWRWHPKVVKLIFRRFNLFGLKTMTNLSFDIYDFCFFFLFTLKDKYGRTRDKTFQNCTTFIPIDADIKWVWVGWNEISGLNNWFEQNRWSSICFTIRMLISTITGQSNGDWSDFNVQNYAWIGVFWPNERVCDFWTQNENRNSNTSKITFYSIQSYWLCFPYNWHIWFIYTKFVFI